MGTTLRDGTGAVQPCGPLAFSERYSSAAGSANAGYTLAASFCPPIPSKAALKPLIL